MSSFARVAEHSPRQVLERLLEDIENENVDRLLILSMDADGDDITMYSNARSEAEQLGMLHGALHSRDADED
jgi:DNA invertase Pin-like site-specific DNA recombinase